jgi:UDP-N-acetylglucosamine 2-epimerase (non-hydrolysing)
MIYIIIGTKAQLIKMAPVMRELKKNSIPYAYVSTGQHKETIKDIKENFGIHDPEIELYQGKDIVSVKDMAVWFFGLIFNVLLNKNKICGKKITRNDYFLVHGDTFSTLLGALMGRILGAKVVHIESGLRSFNLWNPFPEEITRLMVFRLSDIAFCQDEKSLDNLKNYKLKSFNTHGNTLYDAWRLFQKDYIKENKKENFGVVSMHRFENFNRRSHVEKIVGLLEILSEDHRLFFIMHKVTEKSLKRFNLYDKILSNKNITILPRMSYFDFISILNSSRFLVSDGGSNQEECFYMGKPVILFRHKTERFEGVGGNCLISNFEENLVRCFSRNPDKYIRPALSKEVSPSTIIVDHLVKIMSECKHEE